MKELGIVELTHSVPAGNGRILPEGARGTVVFAYRDRASYAVEFDEPFHSVVTVERDDIRPDPRPTFQVKNMARSSFAPVLDNDPNPELRAELLAALAVLDPRIRGLTDLTSAPVTAELSALLGSQIIEHTQRRHLVQAVLDALDAVRDARIALKNDGYPTALQASAPALLFAELRRELAALQAAVAVFEEQASAVTMTPGIPSDKPEE